MPDYNYNSTKNLRVKDRFVKMNIWGDATEIVDYLLQDFDNMSPLKWSSSLSDANICKCPFCGSNVDTDILVSTLDSNVQIEIDEDAPEEEKYICPVCLSGHPTEQEARNCCCDNFVYYCDNCKNVIPTSEVDDAASDNMPIEWVLVSKWLAEELSKQGETILCSAEGLYFWGRTSCADYNIDETISNICSSLKILEGQENFHEVKSLK